MARKTKKAAARDLAISTHAGRSVRRPSTALVDEADKQERFLAAFARCGILTKALQKSGVEEHRYGKWMTCDEVFAEQYQNARRAWGDKIREMIHQVSFEGVPEPLVHKGEIMYKMDEVGNPLLDTRGRKIPVTVNKRDNRVLMELARANLDEYKRDRGGSSKAIFKAPVKIHVNAVKPGEGEPPPSVEIIDVVPEPVENLDYDPFE